MLGLLKHLISDSFGRITWAVDGRKQENMRRRRLMVENGGANFLNIFLPYNVGLGNSDSSVDTYKCAF